MSDPSTPDNPIPLSDAELSALEPPRPEPPETVLVVDDERTLRRLMGRALAPDNYEVFEAASAEDCLAFCEERLPDAILLDAIMPDLNGFDCCIRLHERFGDRCPPVPIVTALQDNSSVDRAFEVGAADYIPKPIHWTVFRYRIRRLLTARRATRALERSLRREHALSNRLSLQVFAERRLTRELQVVNEQLEHANARLQEVANLDGLTNVPNRRAFDRVLNDWWVRSANNCQYLSLLLFDIDCFKQYNDTYGHPAGDECLRQVAKALTETVYRPPDTLARYGGEEFVALLPDTETAGALAVAERTIAAVRRLNLPHRASKCSDRIALSIGVASTIPELMANPTTLIEVADAALYLAKRNGRNRAVLANDLPESDIALSKQQCQLKLQNQGE